MVVIPPSSISLGAAAAGLALSGPVIALATNQLNLAPSISPSAAAGLALSGAVIASPGLTSPFIVARPAALSAAADGPFVSAISAKPATVSPVNTPAVLNEHQAFERIGAEVRLNLTQLELNISQARSSSSQFFKLTLISAGLGFLVVIAGVVLLLSGQVTAGVVTVASSVVAEITAALLLRKDSELRAALEDYNKNILESQRIITMVDLTETIRDAAERDRLKRDVIFKVLDKWLQPLRLSVEATK